MSFLFSYLEDYAFEKSSNYTISIAFDDFFLADVNSVSVLGEVEVSEILVSCAKGPLSIHPKKGFWAIMLP